MSEFWTVLSTADSSAEGLLQADNRLAGERGLRHCAVLVGSELTEEDVFRFSAAGAQCIYHIPLAPELINGKSVRRCLEEMYRKYLPEAMIFECTQFLADVAPAMAAELDRGITADCTELKWNDGYGLLQIRPTYGGRMMAVNRSIRLPYIATVRKGTFPCVPYEPQDRGTVVRIDPVRCAEEIELKSVIEEAGNRVSLGDAQIILSGGLGIGSRENYARLAHLADLCGAQLGASRAAVAAGYAGYNHQVGQTGVSVSPKIYFAFGISGAVQHLSGILGADQIVAINSDPKAPIHEFSNYSVIADCNAVIEKLIGMLEPTANIH